MAPKKQAVVLIHGIGEQVPMDTLRGFVRAVWSTDSTVLPEDGNNKVWSKPDEISRNYELRRLTTDFDRKGKRTDFFEFYWANLMEDTKLSHVWAWLSVLIFRGPNRLPKQLRSIWWFLVLLGVVIIGAWGQSLVSKLGELKCFNRHEQVTHVAVVAPGQDEAAAHEEAVLPISHCVLLGVKTIGPIVWLLVSWFLIHYIGDAARYLHVAPANIESRREIRKAGIELLQSLHASGKYDRIVVVGHSLGTVIGYDILTHLWGMYNSKYTVPEANNPSSALDALEKLARDRLASGVGNFDQSAQSAYATELRTRGNGWLVTDFVTLGSPLAHAAALMAKGTKELKLKIDEREYPSCPPMLEAIKDPQNTDPNYKGVLQFSYTDDKGVRVPHHAAVFGPVRWTNIFFPCRFTLWGDVIGGEVAPAFGFGVRDVSVKTTLNGGFFTHTCYWTMKKGDETDPPEHIRKLREAVRVCS